MDEISDHFYVRIVDKGAGELWGFCKNGLWNETEEFLRAEKYITVFSTPELFRKHGPLSGSRVGMPTPQHVCVFCILLVKTEPEQGPLALALANCRCIPRATDLQA